MSHQENNLLAKGIFDQIIPIDNEERAYLEWSILSDYERCHPDETFEDLKRRARFTKEDRGLLYEWMALAARRLQNVVRSERYTSTLRRS
jgi:hypothetical protein